MLLYEVLLLLLMVMTVFLVCGRLYEIKFKLLKIYRAVARLKGTESRILEALEGVLHIHTLSVQPMNTDLYTAIGFLKTRCWR